MRWMLQSLAGSPIGRHEAVKAFVDVLKGEETEHQVLLPLDANNNLLKGAMVFDGNKVSVSIDVEKLTKELEKIGAKGVVFAHNHPAQKLQSGLMDSNLTPSAQDLETFGQSMIYFGLLGISVLDHLIIGQNGGFLSMVDVLNNLANPEEEIAINNKALGIVS